jgi:hypothetical protein
MKKLILLSISVFLGLQLAASSSARAQNFNIVASFGSTQNWGVPIAITYEVDYFYPYHRFVHVNRFVRGRGLFFNVLLERYGEFVELTFESGGNIINSNYFNNYPLASHICSSFCGYHSDYYFQQQVVCNSHHHGGHNHINYYQQPRYSRPNSVRVTYNNGRRNNHVYHGKNGQRNRNTRNNEQFNNSRANSNDRSTKNRSSSTQVRTVSRSTSGGKAVRNSSSSSSTRSQAAKATSPSNRSSSNSRNISSSTRGSRN